MAGQHSGPDQCGSSTPFARRFVSRVGDARVGRSTRLKFGQLSLLFGPATVAIAAALLAGSVHKAAWSPASPPVVAIAGTLGAAGVFIHYLALDSADAEGAVPLLGAYPAVAALASAVFHRETLSRTQVLGVALAIGIVLVGRGR